MKLNFVKVNPVENMTIFVLDQFSRIEQAEIAKKLMDYNSIYGEQVGFIERSKKNDIVRLQMMGGEFCGNASRSLAALLVDRAYSQIEVEDEGVYKVLLEASGMEDLIECRVRRTEVYNEYYSEIKMPKPLSIDEKNIYLGDSLIKSIKVEFEGIIHFIVDSKEVEDKDKLYIEIKKYMDEGEYEAFGIMYYDYDENFLNPLVYVKPIDSLFWERSCASGTCALTAALTYLESKDSHLDIRQPGGVLTTSISYRDKKVEDIRIDGLVKIVAEGVVYL